MGTIEGQLALNIAGARRALGNIGRSTVYRLISDGKLEVVRFDGRPKITARSILKLLGLTETDVRATSVALPTARGTRNEPAETSCGDTARRHSRRRRIDTGAKLRAR